MLTLCNKTYFCLTLSHLILLILPSQRAWTLSIFLAEEWIKTNQSAMPICQWLKMTAHRFIIKKPVANTHSPVCSRAARPRFANGRPVTWFNIQIDSLSHALREPACTKSWTAGPVPSMDMDMDGTSLLQTFAVSHLCGEPVGATLLSLSPVISFTPLAIYKTVFGWPCYFRQGCVLYWRMHCAFFIGRGCFFQVLSPHHMERFGNIWTI